MDARAVWASVALMPMVSGCGGSTTKDPPMTDVRAVAIATVGGASIAVDSNVVYWTDACPAHSSVDSCGGELMKVPVAGGMPVRLAT